MKGADLALAGMARGTASVTLAHVELASGDAVAPSKPQYCTYVVGQVNVASPTVQVRSFLSENVFGASVAFAPPPTKSVSVSVILSKLVFSVPFVYTVTCGITDTVIVSIA